MVSQGSDSTESQEHSEAEETSCSIARWGEKNST